MIRKSTKLIHEGKYAAEVVIEFLYGDDSWSPTMSIEDARKLEVVQLALRRGNIAEAAKYGQVRADAYCREVAARESGAQPLTAPPSRHTSDISPPCRPSSPAPCPRNSCTSASS
jgi:hypothetical protein